MSRKNLSHCSIFHLKFSTSWASIILGSEIILTLLASTPFADVNNKWGQSRQQNPTFVSWLFLIQKNLPNDCVMRKVCVL